MTYAHDGMNTTVEQSPRLDRNRQVADEKKQPERRAVVEAVKHRLVRPLPRAALQVHFEWASTTRHCDVPRNTQQ